MEGNPNPEPTLAEIIAELMAGWRTIETAAKERFPQASEEEIFRLTSMAMDHALGFDRPKTRS